MYVCVQVMLDASHGVEVPVIFKPSSLGSGEHTAHISFTSQEVSRIYACTVVNVDIHNKQGFRESTVYYLLHAVIEGTSPLLQFGSQVFVLKGKGLEPSTMAPTTIQASLNSNSTHILTFTNPLDTATHFRVDLQGSSPSEHFCLLMKRTRGILLHPGVALDIPVMFAPEAMHTHNITVIVSTDERGGRRRGSHLNLAWKYPIIGQPEFRPVSPSMAPRLSCQAKERLEQRMEVVLVGCKMSKAALIRPVTPSCSDTEGPMPQTPHECDSYTYQLVCLEEECSSIVQDSIGVRLLRKEMENEDSAKLVFAIVFAPPKAFR